MGGGQSVAYQKIVELVVRSGVASYWAIGGLSPPKYIILTIYATGREEVNHKMHVDSTINPQKLL